MTSTAPDLPVEPGHEGGLVAAYVRHRAVTAWARGRMGPDEMVDAEGAVLPAAHDLAATVDLLGIGGLLARRVELARLVEDEGVTYGGTRRWRVDPLPVVIGHEEWTRLEEGLAQRADLLDHVLADLSGPRRLLRSGVLPADVVLAHRGFVRAADGVRPGPGRSLFLVASDLARQADGTWAVVSDRTQAPSGAGYAMQNRRLVSRVMPGLYRGTHLERLRTFFHTMRAALQEAAPATAEAPRVVLLTPGPASETAFDQAFLATLLGYPLVEGEDLTVRQARLFQLSLGRMDGVDVVLRRVDAEYADPLELRPDSRLGVPGLLEACRLGNVAVVNPLGAGVLENPGLMAYLPQVFRAVLGADPILPAAQTWWCGEPASRSHVLANLDRLVLKPLARDLGRASIFGSQLSRAALEDLGRRIEAEPHDWCAQEPLETSTAPAVTATGLQPRRLVLRTFAVAQGGRYHLMAGGLARVAGAPGQHLISNAAGALAKDVWVLSAQEAAARPGLRAGAGDRDVVALSLLAPGPEAQPALPPRVAENLFWLGRYAERAEDTARLLRVADDLVEDFSTLPGSAGARGLEVLLRAVTEVTHTFPGFASMPGDMLLEAPRQELVALVVDAEREGTLAHSLRRAAWAAHAVREQLSMDTWTVLAGLDRVLADLADPATAAGGAALTAGGEVLLQPALARILEGLLALAGLGAESMVRDTGWYVMDAGRRIERSLQMLQLLRFTIARRRSVGVEQLVLESVLVAGESVITHRRRTSGRAEVGGVLELLMLDRSNPRAVAYQLDRLAEDIARMPEVTGGGSARLLGEITARLREARLEIADRAVLQDPQALEGTFATLVEGVSALAEALEAEHFVHAAPLRPFGTPGARRSWGVS